MIRDVQKDDAKQIADIYNYYVNDTIVTFDLEPKSVQEMEEIIKETTIKYPWLVYTEGYDILGYAYAAQWKSRCAYDHSVESTIYLKQEAFGRGIGTQLYSTLLKKLEDINIHTVIGGISLPNMASVALHEKLGFVKVGQFREVGYKFDKWIDVGYWEKIL